MITTRLLDLLFPKRCIGCRHLGDHICDNCLSSISFATETRCPECNKLSIDGATHPKCVTRYSLDGVSSGVAYRGVVKKLVYQFKYAPYLSTLDSVMGRLLYESIIQNEIAYKKLSSAALLVPVPLHSSKQRKRGYNHAELLARDLGKKLNKEVCSLIVRTRATNPQFKLSREERYKNLKGAFAVHEKNKGQVRNTNIILVDDVATSCATLNECANALKRAGAKSVWAITFARE